MLGNHKIILDSFCEMTRMLASYADQEFYELSDHDFVHGAVYIISRQQFTKNKSLIVDAVQQGKIHAILANPAEGSEAMYWMFKHFGIDSLEKTSTIPVVTGGYLSEEVSHFYLEYFLPLIREVCCCIHMTAGTCTNWVDLG